MVHLPRQLHSSNRNQKKNVLIFCLQPEGDQSYMPDIPMAFCLALEKKGCSVTMASFKRNDDLKIKERDGRVYVKYEERKFKLPDLDERNKDYEYFKSLIDERIKNPQNESFKIEEDNGERYIVFPAVEQDIDELDGAIGWNASRQPLRQLLEKNDRIVPLNTPDSIEVSWDKIKFHECMKAAGISIPVTVCLHSQDGYDEDRITQELYEGLTQKGVTLPFMIKANVGVGGTDVYEVDTLKKALDIIRKLIQSGKGVVVQEKIEPLAENPEWIRLVVADGKVIGARRCIGKAGAFPDKMDKIIDHIVAPANRMLHDRIEPYKPTTKEKRVAIATTRALGLRVSGIDIMKNSGNPVALEAADCPALKPHMRLGQYGIVDKAVKGFVKEMIRNKESVKQKISTFVARVKTRSDRVYNR